MRPPLEVHGNNEEQAEEFSSRKIPILNRIAVR